MWDVDFTGIGVGVITLQVGALIADDVRKVVKISADKTPALCAAEDPFYGVVDTVDPGNISGVQRKGFIEVKYSGAAPGLNQTELVADGLGGVKVPAVAGTGRNVFIVNVDEAAGTLVMDLG